MTTTLHQIIAPGRYRIEPSASAVRFTTKKLFDLLTVRGTVAVGTGEVHVPEDPRRSTVYASVDVASFASGNARRDRDVISRRFLDATAFPEMTFESTEIVLDADGRRTLCGVMTAHGQRQEVRFDIVECAAMDAGYRVLARGRIDRTGFGVAAATAIISRFVDVELEIVLMR